MVFKKYDIKLPKENIQIEESQSLEDKKNEFKSTLRWNTKTDTSDGKDRQEHSVIKSIAAFLNTH